MTIVTRSQGCQSPLLARLARLAPLSPEEIATVQNVERSARRWRARSELAREGQPVQTRLAVLSGWACRLRILVEGQRQILIVLLPGDLIGSYRHANAVTASTVQTVTEVETAVVPDAPPETALAEVFARAAAFEEHYLVAQITRIGRLDAYERIVDWLLETCDRLAFVGLASRTEFPLPVTQEFMADTLSLTSVHVNRMMQALRRDGMIASRGNSITFPDRGSLEKLVDYHPVRVSSDVQPQAGEQP